MSKAAKKDGEPATKPVEVATRILDVNGVPCEVVIVEGKNFDSERDGTLIFVESPTTSDVLSVEQAKNKFRYKDESTIVYDSRGFAPVDEPLDIVALSHK